MNGNVWKQPLTVVQKFAPNEYVAACGDHGVTYKFECNAGKKDHEYSVYKYNSWGQKEYLSIGWGWNAHKIDGRDWYYHPCEETHVANSDSGFLKGYYIDDLDTWKDEKIEVIVWTAGNSDVHCTTNLNMDKWETAKS